MAMGTSERKERNRTEREQRILQVGRQMLVAHGYRGLSMDRIAAEIEYSKGIVYQHFSSKEDLLCAISIDLLKEGMGFFRRASQFSGRARERLTAVAVASQLLLRLNPDSFQAQLIIWVNSIAEKAPQERQASLGHLQSELVEILTGLVQDAVRRKELVLPADFVPLGLVHGMWAMLIGNELLAQCGKTAADFKSLELGAVTRRNLQIFWDGFGWKPFSTKWDYEATVKRVLDEVFAQEHEKLLKMGQTL
jgi:AcrR family transcriptional regulator